MQISGHTELIAHIGYPTHSFKAPMIYNPYFEQAGLDVVVVPMGCEAADFAQFLPQVFRLRNLRGALITMPHKVSTVAMLDELSPAVRVAGACNAVKRDAQGRLVGDMFDGAGFVRGAKRKGLVLEGARVLVVGSGGVGCAIAASLAAEGVAEMTLFDVAPDSAQALAERLRTHYPRLKVTCGSNDPAGYDLVVNATPLGMNPDDPLPMPVARLEARTFVGEVVMKTEVTPLLAAARERGCATQVGTDMLFEMIPAYLEFFDLPTTSADNLRALSRVAY
ncbi:MAG: shikimate dehydrogenase [Limnohabitans sp.]|nr:shikimate dehydrogenase [Limnohabitans sp.]